MKITVGITVYNRKQLLIKSVQSICSVNGIEKCSIRIYNDASTEIDEDFIRRIFPEIDSYVCHEKRKGADYNMAYMYNHFLESGDDYFFNADADLIYNSEIIKNIEDLIPHTQGVLSLYNSVLHPYYETIKVEDKTLVKKASLGAAGTVFSREIMEKICKNLSESDNFDWKWTEFLRNEKIELFAVKESLVQHIGIDGYNQRWKKQFDYGKNFVLEGETNNKILAECYETLAARNNYTVEHWYNFHYWYKRTRLFKIIKKFLLPGFNFFKNLYRPDKRIV